MRLAQLFFKALNPYALLAWFGICLLLQPRPLWLWMFSGPLLWLAVLIVIVLCAALDYSKHAPPTDYE
jgi:hypothetical protein